MSNKKTIVVGDKEHSYLDKLITSELEKFDDIIEKTDNVKVREERDILNNLKKVL